MVLKNLAIEGITIPILAHQWHAAVLRHHEFQHCLFQVWPMVFGVAMGDSNGMLVTLRKVFAGE